MCDLRCREEFENVGTFIVLRRKTGLFTHEKYLLPLIFAVYHDAGVKRYFAPADIEWDQHC